MSRGIAATALLACLPLAAGAGEPIRAELQPGPGGGRLERVAEGDPVRPVRFAAMIGLVSLPRPVDAEVLVLIADLFGIGFGYSDFPAFVADPLLDLAGVRSASTTPRLDRFDAFELDLRVFPFRGRFFVGSSFGHQSLKGALTESTIVGPQTATVDLSTWYATPRVGWMWTFDPGFLVGLEIGVQLKLLADRTVTVPAGATPEVRNRVNNFADLGSSYPLPSLRLRIGWML